MHYLDEFSQFYSVPVSITNALVGSMVGFGWLVLGSDAVQWKQVSHIAVGWITSPLISGVTAYALFTSIQLLIFVRRDVLEKSKALYPFLSFFSGLSFIFYHRI